ncbi:hypothetical protein BABINDRAFT_12088 [Babjeviella inositovora NRRL Y-12698]|uniref:PRA1 family protein n=1 Tax=Babjeviella inositovora NRRL Y-12698 TaxID=984486 RepID=A0A1E3QY87_9ASCO|nr:uncharacterized protein BABINDRAFT_12088 [Babjeviella inositovora NRRL Y-12698]ODQ82037.1 hypothetical protein BABINDRAFT_12088 [Babjeviella inositovora NRRL Y-12698]
MSFGQLASIPFAQFSDRFNLERLQSEAGNLRTRFANLKPPQEFFDVRRVSKPANFGEIQQRVTYNVGYFGSNYLAVIGLLSVYSLITNTLLMFVLAFVILGTMGINKLGGEPLNTPFGSFNTSQLYTGLCCVALPLGFWASPISTLMWLIGTSAVTVLGHASLMEKPIELVFEEETV